MNKTRQYPSQKPTSTSLRWAGNNADLMSG